MVANITDNDGTIEVTVDNQDPNVTIVGSWGAAPPASKRIVPANAERRLDLRVTTTPVFATARNTNVAIRETAAATINP